MFAMNIVEKTIRQIFCLKKRPVSESVDFFCFFFLDIHISDVCRCGEKEKNVYNTTVNHHRVTLAAWNQLLFFFGNKNYSVNNSYGWVTWKYRFDVGRSLRRSMESVCDEKSIFSLSGAAEEFTGVVPAGSEWNSGVQRERGVGRSRWKRWLTVR